jgi:hypothetical protein
VISGAGRDEACAGTGVGLADTEGEALCVALADGAAVRVNVGTGYSASPPPGFGG